MKIFIRIIILLLIFPISRLIGNENLKDVFLVLSGLAIGYTDFYLTLKKYGLK